jgi:ABC-2 type transport system permease protein
MSVNYRAIAWSVRLGAADFGVMYTWRTWSLAWVPRVVCQVVIYALIAKAYGDERAVLSVAVGASLAVASSAVLAVIASTAWEQREGNLEMLMSSPASVPTVLLFRSTQWIADGIGAATVAFFCMSVFFGLEMSIWNFMIWSAGTIVGMGSVYALGFVLASVALVLPQLRMILVNVTAAALLLLTGAIIRPAWLPEPLAYVGQVLPLTHALEFIRGGGAHSSGSLLVELLVGTTWMIVGLLVFKLVERRMRHGY